MKYVIHRAIRNVATDIIERRGALKGEPFSMYCTNEFEKTFLCTAFVLFDL